MDQLDDIVKSAMQALEATTPRGYFDELPSRIEARLEGSMQTDSDRNSDQAPLFPPTASGADEDSGVHDIKALARTAKQRVSRRITTQNDVVQDVLSASHSGLHAVALPDPAKMVSLPSVDEARAMAESASTSRDDLAIARGAAATSTAHEPRASARRGVPAWLWAGGGLAAAAAAVFAFVQLGGKDAEPPAPQATAGEASAARPGAMPEPSKDPARDDVAARGVIEPTETQALDGAGSAAAVAAAPAEPDAQAEPEAGGDDKKAKEVATGADRSDRKDERDRGDERDKDDKDVEDPAPKKSGGGSKADKTVKNDKPDGKAAGGDVKKKGDGAVLGAGDKDELGIGDALTGGGGKVDKPSKTELTSRELRDGLESVVGKAKACYGAHGVAGTVKVKLTVDPSGKITKGSATGAFAGTPTGDCVVSALKSASFPAWDGAPRSTTYAVLLSD